MTKTLEEYRAEKEEAEKILTDYVDEHIVLHRPDTFVVRRCTYAPGFYTIHPAVEGGRDIYPGSWTAHQIVNMLEPVNP